MWKRAAEGPVREPVPMENTPPQAEERAEPVETLPAAPPDTPPAPQPAARAENRRKHVRTRVNFQACIRSYTFGDDIVACEDISHGGLRFKSGKPYVEKTEIEAASPYTPRTPDIFVRGQSGRVRALKLERRFSC